MYPRCGGVTDSNVVRFTKDGTEDVRANLSAAESIVNTKVIKNLLCFVYDDRRRDKIPSRVTNLFRKETFLTIFF